MSIPQHPILSPFLDFIKFEKRYSAHTYRAYADDLTTFFSFAQAQFDVSQATQITPGMIRSWMASLTLQKVQPRSINRKISSLKSFFRYCLIQGQVTTNPTKTIQVLKTKKRLPSYVEQDQMETLLKETVFPDDFGGRGDHLILSLLYHTGIRVSELVGLKSNQIDYSRSQLKVLGKGNKERIIPLNGDLLERIKAYTQEKNDLFPEANFPNLLLTPRQKPPSARQVYDIVKKYLSLVTTSDKKSPHVLRHSFATHLTGNGAELNAVKELLGHSSLAATQVYTHNNIERLRDIHKKAHPKG
ncbi:MAG: tyrosine-type recombinase/integrase [Chitinophagaceae bacterium]|nr:tyrosine-type recombinase/integrase [Chitinophagaceae bacterium]